MLEKEFKYYLDNQAELLTQYEGLFVVIKDEKVIGAYNSEIEALTFTEKEHEIGSFLIQKCTPGNEDYTASFHSRVVFNV